MSFHLEGPWLSTTRTKSRGEKTTKAQREQLERDWRERNVRLRGMGLPKESFEQFLEWVYGRGKAMALQTGITSKSKATNTREAQKSSKDAVCTTLSITRDQVTQTDSILVDNKPRSLGSWITGACSSKPSPTYTGTKIKGIGTMHKSNAVPIFSDDEAKDISTMRR